MKRFVGKAIKTRIPVKSTNGVTHIELSISKNDWCRSADMNIWAAKLEKGKFFADWFVYSGEYGMETIKLEAMRRRSEKRLNELFTREYEQKDSETWKVINQMCEEKGYTLKSQPEVTTN